MNQVALITGGSRGIGRGIALELAGLGFDLTINFTSHAEAAQAVAAECANIGRKNAREIRAEICQADIARSGDRQKLIDFARSAFGRLDLLVNNAGVAPLVRADVLEATEESFDRLIEINLKGPYFLTQLAARWMIEQSRSEGGRPAPKIVNVTSVSAYAASSNRGDYCLSKAALSMMTQLYASRLAEYGINVYEIRPGVIATDMTASVKDKYDQLIGGGLTPIRRWGQPSDVAKAVAAIAMGYFPFSTGEVLNVDGGFHIRKL